MNIIDKQLMFEEIISKLGRSDFYFFISTMINCGLEERIYENLMEEDQQDLTQL